MARAWDKVRELLRELGPADTCLYALSRALRRLGIGSLHRYMLVAQPVQPPADRPQRAGSIQVREVTAEEYDADWFPRPMAVIADRYRQGATCLTAFQKDKPIGFIWLIRNTYLEDEVRCRYLLSPPDTTAWDFDVYLAPDYRFGRGFGRLWGAADALLHSEGRHWTLSRIDAFNASSLKAHARRGAIVKGQALFIRILGVQLMLSNLAPYLHLSPGQNRIPALKVSSVGP